MEKEEIKKIIVKRIDSNIENVRESTSSIIENLIDIRSSLEQSMFLEYFLENELKDKTMQK